MCSTAGHCMMHPPAAKLGPSSLQACIHKLESEREKNKAAAHQHAGTTDVAWRQAYDSVACLGCKVQYARHCKLTMLENGCNILLGTTPTRRKADMQDSQLMFDSCPAVPRLTHYGKVQEHMQIEAELT